MEAGLMTTVSLATWFGFGKDACFGRTCTLGQFCSTGLLYRRCRPCSDIGEWCQVNRTHLATKYPSCYYICAENALKETNRTLQEVLNKGSGPLVLDWLHYALMASVAVLAVLLVLLVTVPWERLAQRGKRLLNNMGVCREASMRSDTANAGSPALTAVLLGGDTTQVHIDDPDDSDDPDQLHRTVRKLSTSSLNDPSNIPSGRGGSGGNINAPDASSSAPPAFLRQEGSTSTVNSLNSSSSVNPSNYDYIDRPRAADSGNSSYSVNSSNNDYIDRPHADSGNSSTSRVNPGNNDDIDRPRADSGNSSSSVNSSNNDDMDRPQADSGSSRTNVNPSNNDDIDRPRADSGNSSSSVNPSNDDDMDRPRTDFGSPEILPDFPGQPHPAPSVRFRDGSASFANHRNSPSPPESGNVNHRNSPPLEVSGGVAITAVDIHGAGACGLNGAGVSSVMLDCFPRDNNPTPIVVQDGTAQDYEIAF